MLSLFLSTLLCLAFPHFCQAVSFISLPLDNNSKVYQQTLAEIINIGLTVHREIKKHS